MPKYGDNKNLKQAGGMATGGQGGIDDIPALLTEGEVVLNADQQAALSEITGKGGTSFFQRLEFLDLKITTCIKKEVRLCPY